MNECSLCRPVLLIICCYWTCRDKVKCVNSLNQAKVVCLDVLRWWHLCICADAFDLKLVAKPAFDRLVSH